MLRVGITGQSGFIGQYLYNTIGLSPDKFFRVDFHRDFFEDEEKLLDFINRCDVVVHLAALNRHSDQKIIYNTNVDLVIKLCKVLERSSKKPHVIFSSSSQEEKDNEYGRSKKEGRQILAKIASKNKFKFTGLVVPNVFGPFGNPNYNSFISTFCHQLTHGETPSIAFDDSIKLIYVGDLVEIIINQIVTQNKIECLGIKPTAEFKVSEVLSKLLYFKEQYFDQGIIPELKDIFDLNLFNTFRSYVEIADYFPIKYVTHSDFRGTFVELIRLGVGGQVSFSITGPGVTRGNHFHTRKIERFSVIKGEALIQLRKIGSTEVIEFTLNGDDPAYVDMPIWYTHNIKNIGNNELLTNFWINEFYNPEDTDTYLEVVQL
jgi:UDP-2-acetamido-2,6-beta-L-arabino-hexul-4-ose reductase